MVNKALRLVIILVLSIPLLFVVPFNNIYADTLSSSNIKGLNTSFLSKTETSGSDLYMYEYELVLDKNYVGWVSVKVVNTYYSDNNQTQSQNQFNQAIYINGNSAKFTYSFYSSGNYSGEGCLVSASYSLIASNVLAYGEIESLQQIIDLLTDINDVVSIDVLDELQNIVTNTSLANNYLETISKLRQYDLYPESYSWCSYLFNNNFVVNENTKIYYFNYPVYSIEPNKQIYWTINLGTGTYQKLWLFFASNIYLNSSNIGNYFNLSSFNVEHLSSIEYYKPMFIYRLCLSGNYSVNQNQNYTLNTLQRLTNFIPLSAGIYRNNDINQIFPFNSELALYLGVNNKELNYLDIIANGTTASSSAAQSSDSANSQLQQDSNTLFTQEDSFKQNMNSAMQNIDTTFSLNNFGSSFMTSAQWVRTQYERLTNNTPFASLITFSLLVGLALIVVGKVYK